MVSDALTATGGGKLKSVRTVSMMSGSGIRTRLQEQVHVTDPEEPGTLTNVIDIKTPKLDVKTNVGGYGGVAPSAELETAVNRR